MYPSVTRIYIDGNNLGFSAKEMNIDVDFQALQLLLIPQTGRATFNYYTGITSNATSSQKYFISCLEKYGYKVALLPIVHFKDGTAKTVGDDMSMGIDIVEDSQIGDRVIIVSGDGDFVPVVKKIQDKGIKATVVAYKKNTSHDLRHIADDFIDLDPVKYQIAKHTKLTIA